MAESTPTTEYKKEFTPLEHQYALLVDLLNDPESGWLPDKGQRDFNFHHGMGDEKSTSAPVDAEWQTINTRYNFSLRSGYTDEFSGTGASAPNQVVATLYDNYDDEEVLKVINPTAQELIGTIRARGAEAKLGSEK